MQRCDDALTFIGSVIDKVYRSGRPVVFADGVDHCRIAIAAQILLKNLFFQRPIRFELPFDVMPQEIFRIEIDELFRERLGLN